MMFFTCVRLVVMLIRVACCAVAWAIVIAVRVVVAVLRGVAFAVRAVWRFARWAVGKAREHKDKGKGDAGRGSGLAVA